MNIERNITVFPFKSDYPQCQCSVCDMDETELLKTLDARSIIEFYEGDVLLTSDQKARFRSLSQAASELPDGDWYFGVCSVK